jgi:hypothetical protein
MSDSPHARRRVVAVPARRPPAELRALRAVVEEDPDPDVSYLAQEDLAERRTAHERGEFGLVGVRVEADVFIEGTEQTLTSPGLWGVESDLSEDELDQLVAEEWSALRAVLKAVGVSTEQLPLEADREWIEWRT